MDEPPSTPVALLPGAPGSVPWSAP